MSSLKDSIDIADAEKKTLLKLLKYYLPNTEVWAYGSRVSWTSSPTSDLDLVAFASLKQKAAVSKLREALEASSLPFRVDLFIWDEVPETFRGPIKETHVVLQESEKEALGQSGESGGRGQLNVVPVSSVIEIIGGGTPTRSKAEYWNGEIPWLSVVDFNSDDRWVDNTEQKITELGLKNSSTKLLKAEDIILSARETVGAIAQLSIPMTFNQSCYGIRGINSKSKTSFVYYALKNAISSLKQVAHGGVFDTITRDTFDLIEIALPTISEQEKIVDILGALDNKIALNLKLNETLEGMARALFQSWFVDFDPVKAKLAAVQHGLDTEKACMAAISGKLRIPSGKPKHLGTPTSPSASYNTNADKDVGAPSRLPTAEELDAAIATLDTLSEAQSNQLAQTASAFPATFQESELGLIPKSWTITNIESIIQLAYGKALKKNERQNGDVPVYGSGGVNGYHNKHLVEGPGIIVGRKGTVGSIYWERKNFFPIDTVFYVKPKEGIPLIWTLYLLETLGLKDMNTDAAVPGLNRNNVYRIELPNFPFRLIQLFASETSLIRKEIDANETQSRTLAQMRDTLLPKLLSGELSVDKVQKFIKTTVES